MFRLFGSLLKAVIFFAFVFAMVYIFGSQLPQERTEIVGTVIHAPQSKIWAILNDPQALLAFRSRVKSITPLPSRDGHPCWSEDAGKKSTLCETASSPESLRTVSTISTDEMYSGTWTYKLTATDVRTTEVTCMETSIVPSPIFRFVGHYIFRADTVQAKAYLDSLKNAAEGQ